MSSMCKVFILFMLSCGGAFGSKELDLYNAASNGDLVSVTESLASGADPNWRNNDGYVRTALHAAAFGNHAAVVKVLLDSGAKKDLKDGKGWTPLLDAARQGSAAAVETLISYGAGVDIPAQNGASALHWAAYQNHVTVLKVLLDGGVDKDLQDHVGFTPLIYAAMFGSTAAVEILIRYGADVDIPDHDNRGTPLMYAIQFGYTSSAEALINAHANLDIQAEEGITALHWAVYTNESGLAQLLLQNGANAIIRTDYGLTPGDVARSKGYYQLADTIDNFTGPTNDTDQPTFNKEEL